MLFSLSGLGKTSLLGAGLFPRLRRRDFLPIHLRLNLDLKAGDIDARVKAALVKECRRGGGEASPPKDAESVWEYLHRPEVEFWSDLNRLLTPVLVFDQFEKIFSRLPDDVTGRRLRKRII